MDKRWHQPVKTLCNIAIVSMDAEIGIIENGYLVIEGDEIKQIGSSQPNRPVNPIDLKGKIVMPGLINTHTHLSMTLYRGLADDLPLHDWLQNHIWPAEAKYTNQENITIGTNLGLCEMIRTGTTTFSDMYFFAQTTAGCAEKAGIRAVLGEAIVDFPTNNYKSVDEALTKAEQFIITWQNHPLVYPAIITHTPYTCSKETLVRAMALSDKYQVPFTIHVSETRQEIDDMLNKCQMTPVGYMGHYQLLNNRVCAAHMVWPQPDDFEILAKNNVSISHCPSSNLKLASGIAPVAQMLEQGINVSLGTDGCASNNNLNLLREMRLVSLIHKGNNLDALAIKDRQALEMATVNGAKALGIDHLTGSLKVGKKADLLVIDTNNSFLTPLYDYYSAIVYSMEANCIETLLVNGKALMIEHQLTTIDEKACLEEMNRFKTNIKHQI